ncbi:halocyanin domain-containing protein [Halobacterium rubrum]|uniref:halocyanin domain-containing protein n=1 Tax=Halobacterium TaxID=2239 RepID=UPI001F3706B4|nr:MULTISPECIES: halocyanin domain-containing protein [Halobacterium]MDH5019316.1 halocyanin domain-containing protein [Halobacterium rubrum]
MSSPLDDPDGNWWDRQVNRRETIWLGLSAGWAVSLFGWMLGWTEFGDQNNIGETYEISPERFQEKVSTFKENAGTLTVDDEEYLVPDGEDIYIGAFQWGFDGLPVVVRPNKEYKVHLGTYDVQHGFSARNESNLSQQISLQMIPGYEWVLEMSWDDTGTYQVICNEFCGNGHRSMHGKYLVRDHEEVETGPDAGGGQEESGPYGGWLTSDNNGGTADNFDDVVDETGSSSVTVEVGAEGNGGPFANTPAAVKVEQGTTVSFEWVSNGHNVVLEDAPDGSDWSGVEALKNEGYSHEHTFETTGVYKYYCDPHLQMGMKGVVEVV